MIFVQLLHSEMYTDGGSLAVGFTDDSGLEHRLFLQASRQPDPDGYHHGSLYANCGRYPMPGFAEIAKTLKKEPDNTYVVARPPRVLKAV